MLRNVFIRSVFRSPQNLNGCEHGWEEDAGSKPSSEPRNEERDFKTFKLYHTKYLGFISYNSPQIYSLHEYNLPHHKILAKKFRFRVFYKKNYV